MEEVICQRCATINDYFTVPSGPHLKAVCNNCNVYIKFLPQKKELPKLYFGKYVGQYVHEINDVNYLRWLLTSTSIKQSLKDAINLRLAEFI
jgi:hypothetical protein